MAKKLELLAPVGNFPMLQAAVNAGADAVYFGLKEFSMRAGARNFEIKDLAKIRAICKKSERDVKMYVTLNTIVYDEEISKIEKTISKLKNKVDAVICWDLSVIELCKKYNIPFFISTQASVANKAAALHYKKLGAKRVVLARELNLKQVKEITKVIEVEAFAHGAMCVALSGRCFMSQFTFGKSANRGGCLQNCRRAYKVIDKQDGHELELENDKVMSAKDLCTLPFIEELKAAGIMSFKIEGRNRDPRYVDKVIRAYREALDTKLTPKRTKELMQELERVYNRKFSSGFYLGKPLPTDFSDVENSAATEKKHFVGKVVHYLPKVGVALVKVSSEIKKEDNIIIIGKETGIIETNVESMEIKNKAVKVAKKGEEIGIKLPKVRKGDDLYVILKNN